MDDEQEGQGQQENWKLVEDPRLLKTADGQKMYRFDGHCRPGRGTNANWDVSSVIDPRTQIPRSELRRPPCDLPVPFFTIDDDYFGVPPERQVSLFGLSENITQAFLIALCGRRGEYEVADASIFFHPVTEKSLGIALVTFRRVRDAQQAVERLDGCPVTGDIMQCRLDAKGLHVKQRFAELTSDVEVASIASSSSESLSVGHGNIAAVPETSSAPAIESSHTTRSPDSRRRRKRRRSPSPSEPPPSTSDSDSDEGVEVPQLTPAQQREKNIKELQQVMRDEGCLDAVRALQSSLIGLPTRKKRRLMPPPRKKRTSNRAVSSLSAAAEVRRSDRHKGRTLTKHSPENSDEDMGEDEEGSEWSEGDEEESEESDENDSDDGSRRRGQRKKRGNGSAAQASRGSTDRPPPPTPVAQSATGDDNGADWYRFVDREAADRREAAARDGVIEPLPAASAPYTHSRGTCTDDQKLLLKKCFVCGQDYSSDGCRWFHMKSQHSTSAAGWKCPDCQYPAHGTTTGEWSLSIVAHVKAAHPKKGVTLYGPYCCELGWAAGCQWRFFSLSEATAHAATHHADALHNAPRCPLWDEATKKCGFQVKQEVPVDSRVQAMHKHVQHFHPLFGPTPAADYRCPYCHALQSTARTLHDHRHHCPRRNNPLPPPTTDADNDDGQQLQQPPATSTGGGRSLKSVAGTSTTRRKWNTENGKLFCHMPLANGSLCPRAANNSLQLSMHKVAHHRHLFQYPCTERKADGTLCDLRCISARSLQGHKRSVHKLRKSRKQAAYRPGGAVPNDPLPPPPPLE